MHNFCEKLTKFLSENQKMYYHYIKVETSSKIPVSFIFFLSTDSEAIGKILCNYKNLSFFIVFLRFVKVNANKPKSLGFEKLLFVGGHSLGL